ncbi:MAG: hypothetical protein ABJN62_12590 [Halioglobus sp.]
MWVTKNQKFLMAGLVFSCGGAATAGDLEDAATELCEKVKHCSMAQISEADLTPEVRQMMEPMLQNMCATMRAGVQQVPSGHPLHDPALECMRSMAALSCDEFQEEGKVDTPACKEYQEVAAQMAENE